jgi:hypothetical protein
MRSGSGVKTVKTGGPRWWGVLMMSLLSPTKRIFDGICMYAAVNAVEGMPTRAIVSEELG